MPAAPLRIAPVESARDLRRFIALPHRVYAGDPNWVPPLHHEIHKLLDRKKNPFFTHSDAALWLAWRGDEPVGRISAQINRLHLDRYHDATGNFGFLEAFDDQEIFDALLATAEDWLRKRGMRRAVGPYSLTINDEIGILVTRFDTPPMALMPHALPYYGPRVEAAGYRKVRDVLTYMIDRTNLDPVKVERVSRVARRFDLAQKIKIRHLDMKNFERDFHVVLKTYNEAWTENWGFLPVTDDEARLLIAAIKPIIRPELILIASVDDKVVGVFAGIPNINEIIKHLNGRLLPFGWLRFLWRMRFAPPRSARLILAGVDSAYRDSAHSGAIMTLMIAEMIQTTGQAGMKQLECGWILEDNKGSRGIAGIVGELDKTYRIYEKELA